MVSSWALAVPCMPAMAATVRLGHADRALVRESVAPAQAGAARPAVRLSISAGLVAQELVLVPSHTLQHAAAASGASVYEGEVTARPGSWARLTRTPGGWVGLWFDGAHYYGIDQAAALAPAHALSAALPGGTPMVFALRDATLEGGSFAGDTLPLPATAEELLPAPPMAAAVLPTRRLSVALVADAELVARDGAQTAANMLARLNIVDGIFANQIGVRLAASAITLLTADEQPFTSTTPSILLEQLRDYRAATATQQAAGLSHLMTGRDLDERTVGIAYLESVCSNRFAASLSEARSSSLNFAALIAAHEIGHVFGAPHDGEEGSACSATADNEYLMAPQLNANSTLSACSIEQMQPVLARAACLAPIDAADAALGAPLEALLALDQQTDVTLTVRSEGNVPVGNVVLSIDLPAALAIDQVVVVGNDMACTGTAPQVQCPLGTLAPGAERTLRMGLRATAPGTGRALLRLTATGDGLADNDTASVRLVAGPGADLAVEATAAPASISVGATTEATVRLRNLGLGNAPDATLQVQVSPGLSLESFTADRTVCTTAANEPRRLECPPFALEAGALATLTLRLRGEAAGTSTLTATVESSLPDPQPGNNRAEQATGISATPPAPAASGGGNPAGSGGGGTGGGITLLALGLLAARLWHRYGAAPSK